MDYEVIDVVLIDENLDPYHEVLHGHQGKLYVDAHTDSRPARLRWMQTLSEEPEEDIYDAPMAPVTAGAKSLDDALSQIGESFSVVNDGTDSMTLRAAFANVQRQRSARILATFVQTVKL